MLTIMLILVCLSTTPPADCNEATAVDIILGPQSPTPIGCFREGLQTAAQMASRVVPGETYLKVHCRSR